MNFRDVLRELNVDFRNPHEHEHVREGWLGVDCQQCSPEWKHFRLGINERYGYANCWVCGKVNLIEALSLASGASYKAIRSLLDGLERRFNDVIGVKGVYKPPKGVGGLLGTHKRYLKKRGFDPDELEKVWGIQGIGLAAKLAWRIFIPIQDHNENNASWTTRSLCEDGARYVSASVQQEAVSRRSLLYGEHLCKKSVIVVEGPTDAWRVGPGAVATMGVSFSRSQVLRLSRYPMRVICMDTEKGAQNQARKLCEMLAPFPGTTYRVELDSEDPGSANIKEVAKLRRLLL